MLFKNNYFHDILFSLLTLPFYLKIYYRKKKKDEEKCLGLWWCLASLCDRGEKRSPFRKDSGSRTPHDGPTPPF